VYRRLLKKGATMSGIVVRTLNGGTTRVSIEALQAFRAGFRGTLLVAGDGAYDEQRRIWNAMIDRHPALIARCTGTADVIAAVRLAREHQLLCSVRGGGHNIAGLAVCDGGLMIDLSPMRGVWVDPVERTVRAQAGCTLGDVDRETQLHGQAAVLGFVSATGIAGLTTGGGFGYLSRRHGWTSDTVLSMEVVTAEGTVVTCSADEHPELFWCLRGGSGNFGIVTSFEYRTYPVGPTVLGGMIAWRADQAPEVLRAYAELSARAPRELTMVALMRIAPPAPWLPAEIHGEAMVGILCCHTGKLDEAEAFLAPLRAVASPVADILQPRPYVQMQSLLDATQPKGRRYYWKSEYLPGLEPALLDEYRARAARIVSPHSAIILFQLGGAIADLPADHSAAGNRDAAYVLNITGAWESRADDAANIAWARESWEALRRFSTGGVYVNFLTDDEGADRVAAAYGTAIVEKLAALKKKYDPMNLFRHTKPFA
jgi:FAD/FMN-containing dehydrogenase